jgi:hypothetical protein
MVSFKTFSKFFDTYINDAVLSEARFRQSKKVKHIADLPMFSLFIDNDILDNENADKLSDSDVQSAFKEARNKISKMGFPAMHANVVFKDLSKEVNQNTGGGVGGEAHRKGKYMSIGIKYISDPEYFVKVIIHEWAHLWMFNNSKGFKKAVKEYYNDILNSNKPKLQYAETELPYEDRSLVFKQLQDIWIPMIERLFSDEVKNDWQANQYILNYNHLTINDAEYLPHLSQLRGISKQNFSDVSVGDEIYLDKVNNGWLIGSVKNINNINRSRREINIPFDQLLSYVDIAPEEIERRFNEIKKPYRPVSAIELRKQVAKYVANRIEQALSNTMTKLRIYNYTPDIYKNFKDAALKILLPNVLKYLRNIVKKPRLGDGLYNKFWLTPASNANITYTKEFGKILLDSQNNKKREELNQFSNLSGKDKSSYREQMKDLVNWADSYGMSNDDELWATGIEEFLKLPPIHRKNIVRLMATR